MPQKDGIPSIGISDEDEKENLQRCRAQRLSRSPHPYHRRQSECVRILPGESRTIVQYNLKSAQSTENSQSKSGYCDGIEETLREPTSPSDSGTEADDESGLILQSLPAPPLRSRKGLKGQEDDGAASPLLTPSYLDDENRRLQLEHQLSRYADRQSSLPTDDERRKAQQKFTRRRRAEFLRRLSETILLGIVGYISSMCQANLISDVWRPGIMAYASAVIGTYLFYPIRLLYRYYALPRDARFSRFFIRIPAAFDPATLLYPVLIPVFVACSLVPRDDAVLLPNLILSISSIPRAILPIHDWSLGQSSFHWGLSSLPLALSSSLCHTLQQHKENSVKLWPNWLEPETMMLLYPLHQALLPTLGYLTTTSLLPAELQLLSVSMINLLLFSRSPYSVILQALFWIGGVATFVLCGHVLRWGVALARIPTWRFRHPRLRSRDTYILLSAIDDCFHRRLSKWISTLTEFEEPGRDESLDFLGIATVTTKSSKGVEARRSVEQEQLRIANGAADGSLPGHDFKLNDLPIHFVQRSQRRHTLPTSLKSASTLLGHSDLKQTSEQRPARRKYRQLTRLTNAQARVLKWIFAGYVYSIVLAIIAFPVRKYIRKKALGGWEPVGWALGYLFGNIPVFRQTTLQWALEDWVALPEPCDEVTCNIWRKSHSDCIQGSANTRLLMCIYCLCIIVVGLITVSRLSASVEVDTRRKVFHGMMVVMFLPCIFVDPPFVALAFVLILAIFILLDLFRASQLPPFSGPLTRFLAPYVDGRDYRGPVVVSHMFLLIGCAIPLWLSLAGTKMIGESPWEDWEVQTRDLSMVTGVVCVGMGDAAASLIGRRYGRRRWCWSGGKSLEGSLAFAFAVILGLALSRAWLLYGGWDGDSGDPWSLTLGKASVAAAGASLTEAVLTGGNDNVIVPVILWLLVRGLKV